MTAPIGSLAAYLSVRGAAQARQDILSVQRGLAGAGEAASAAGTALGRTEAGLATVGRGSASAATGANKLRAAQLGVVAATERWNAVLADENATIAQTANAQRALILANERVTATTQSMTAARVKAAEAQTATAAATAESSVATSRFAQATGGTVKQLGLMFGGFELLKKAIDIGRETAQFQKEMLLIQTNANASASEVATLSDAVLKLSPQVATGPLELAKALYHIEQNGHGILTTAQMMDALRIGAEGAKIGMADVEDTTNTMTIALASGIKGMGSMQQAMGTMIAIAGTGDMRLRDLNEALSGGILSVAKGYGATLGDVAAVLATLGDNGIRGADAATSLRQTMMGFAEPAAKGEKALKSVGLAFHDLRDDMEKHGLVYAMNDLEKHMQSAGVTGSKVGGFITEAFGKKAGAGLSVLMGEIDRVNIKFDEGQKGAASFAAKWEATTKTASFAFKKLGVEVDAAGIGIARGAMPAVTGIAQALGILLPAALHTAGEALHPFVAAWHGLEGILGPVGSGLAAAAGALEPIAPVLKAVGGAALGMWVAFKGYQVARAAVGAVIDIVGALYAKAGSALAGVTSAFTTSGAAANAAAMQVMASQQAEAATIDAVAATVARSKAAEAEAIAAAAAEVGAAEASEADAAVASARTFALAAEEKAAASKALAVSTAASAEKTAAAAAAESAAVRTGWASMLGPLALVGVGVGVLVSMFHSSTQASKEATDAAKAYGDVLKGGGDRTTFVDAIGDQLRKNNVPEQIDALNKALGSKQFSGDQFVNAIQKGTPAVVALEERLIKVRDAITYKIGPNESMIDRTSKQAVIASKLLASLSDQYYGLTKATKKDLIETAQLSGASSSIDKVAQSTEVGSKTAATYAQMLGIVVDKNGVAAVSADKLQAAVTTVSDAYDKATGTGQGFLDALAKFSSSAGTAADRAALIGSTLKAANGDALNYASAMVGAVAANRALTDGFQSDADKISGLHKNIADLNKQLHDLSGKKNTGKQQADIISQIADAQSKLAQAYRDSEKAAINLRTGAIDFTKGGAPSLVGQLQAIQDAAVKAASATYQHELATKGAKQAADDAYKLYVNQTSGALEDERKQLGLNNTQADKLGKTYFGMPKDVKTLIEQEGGDPVLDVLNKIGRLLAKFTGQPWDIKIDADTAALDGKLKALADLEKKMPGGSNQAAAINKTMAILEARADGGPVTAGVPYLVGEKRPEIFVPNVSGRIEPRVPVGGNKTINVTQHIYYPEPEPVSRLTPHAMRMAALQLDQR